MSALREVILNDKDYLTSLLKDINDAKKTIDLEVYIFENDSAGKIVAKALCKAANRGVNIRVMVDGIGSTTWGGKLTQQMELTGIKTKIFHPLPWKFIHWKRSVYLPNVLVSKIFYLLSKMNYRNHRKVCIIDKKIIYVGSANIHDQLLDIKATGRNWRETSVKITGANIDDAQYAFDKSWGDIKFNKFLHNLIRKKNSKSIFHFNYSRRLRRKFYKFLLDKIASSKKRVWITSPYFVPNSSLLKKLIKASKNAVDVRILLPRNSDVFFIPMVSATFYSSLLKNGVLIYEYTPTILHAKILILDDCYFIGSNNMDNRSLLHDLEIEVEIQTNKAKSVIEDTFLKDINQSCQIHINDLKKQSIFKKILGHVILIVRYWL